MFDQLLLKCIALFCQGHEQESLGQKKFNYTDSRFLILNYDFTFPAEILFSVFYSSKFIDQLKSI